MKDLSSTLFNLSQWSEKEEPCDENYLRNAIAISLFSDARIEELPPHEISHRGYWADALNPKDGNLGSKLWTLSNQPLTEETLNQAIQSAEDSLAWLLKDQTVMDLFVEGTREGKKQKGTLLLIISVETPFKIYNYELDFMRGIHGFL
jgi:phage gp46-like protein